MGGGVGDVDVELEEEGLRERKRQELRDMSRGWSGLELLYRLLEGSWADCGEVEEVEEGVTRDKGLELAAVGPRRRELAAAELILLLLVWVAVG